MAKAIAFLSFLLVIFPAAFAATYNVGGNGGWSSAVDYDNWAGSITFTTADSLVFTYDGSHQVDEVNAANYASCNTASPINTDSNSPTTIALTTAGMRYFVCPRSNHCAQRMKLAVNVTAGTTSPSTPSPPSGTTPSPPSGGDTPSPPSGGDTPSPPTPATRTPSPSAATGLGGGSSFIVGSVLVLVAGLMG